jgi:hypothetical protein
MISVFPSLSIAAHEAHPLSGDRPDTTRVHPAARAASAASRVPSSVDRWSYALPAMARAEAQVVHRRGHARRL